MEYYLKFYIRFSALRKNKIDVLSVATFLFETFLQFQSYHNFM